MSDPQRARAVLGGNGLDRLLDRLVARLQRGDSLNGVVALESPSSAEREAVDRLLGRGPSQGSAVRVQLEELDAVVRHSGLAESLAAAVQIVRGPCLDHRAMRAREKDKWDQLRSVATCEAPFGDKLTVLIEGLFRDGTLKRAAGGDVATAKVLLDQSFCVLRRLPSQDGILLAQLAAEACGDSHALDHGQPVAGLSLRALACLGAGILPVEPADRRALWEQFRVICDELSAPVLVLNLPSEHSGFFGRALRLHHEAGEPYRVSTRQLMREGSAIGNIPSPVYVCENVNVLAAAATKYGPRCPPMVCIDGQPKTAGRLLLDRLTKAGCGLHYHGDFDWPGILIANVLHQRHGITLWRMDRADYEGNASRGSPLVGQPIAAAWDAELAPAMQRCGCAVHEESVVDSLLGDLGAAADFRK